MKTGRYPAIGMRMSYSATEEDIKAFDEEIEKLMNRYRIYSVNYVLNPFNKKD